MHAHQKAAFPESGFVPDPAHPYVGRLGELSWLRRVLEDATSGKPQLALVVGEPGVGKSRLLREFMEQTEGLGHLVGVGRGFEAQSAPYLPWSELLASLSDQATEIPKNAAIGDLLHTRVDHDQLIYERRGDRSLAYSDLSNLFLQVSKTNTLVLVFDDLDWFDEPSIELLNHVILTLNDLGRRRDVRIMVLAAMRPLIESEAVRHVVDRLEREDCCDTLLLGGLDLREVTEFLGTLEIENPSHKLGNAIWEATGGNPLFVKTLVKQLHRRHAIQRHAGFAVSAVPIPDLDLPKDVVSIISRQLSVFDERSIELLTYASFLGDSFGIDTLIAVSGFDEDEVLDLLDGLRSLVWSSGDNCQFEHPMIRRVVYHRLRPRRRAALHIEIATRLEAFENGGAKPLASEIAKHLIAAGQAAPTEMLRSYAERAASEAATVFAWDDAAHAYEAAAKVTQDPQKRARLHMNAGNCYRYSWDPGPCIGQFDQAISAYKLANDDLGIAEALVHKARQFVRRAPVGELVDLDPFETALDLIGDKHPALRGYVLTRLSDAYSHARRNRQAADAARMAFELGESIGDARLCNDASTFLGLAHHQLGHLDAAVSDYLRAIECANRAGDRWLENIPRQRLSLVLCMKGDLAGAMDSANEGLETSRRTRYPGEECMALAVRSKIATALGDLEASEQTAQDAMQAFERSHYVFGAYIALRALACARALKSDWDGTMAAIEQLRRPGRIFEAPGDWLLSACRLLEAYVRVQSGETVAGSPSEQDDLRATLNQHLERYLSGDITSFMLTEVCVVVEMIEASGSLEALCSVTTHLEWAVERHIVLTHGWVFVVPRVLGVAYFLSGDLDKADRQLQAAIRLAGERNAKPELARAYFDLARVLTSRKKSDDFTKARKLVRLAAKTASEVGVTAWHDRLIGLAKDLGITLDTPASAEFNEQLSARERSVLDAMSRGDSTETISQSLILSAPAVTAASRQLIEKIGGAETSDGVPISLTLLVTDLVKSTPMVERLGDQRAHQIIVLHDQIIRSCLQVHSGVEVKHAGDGIMASFRSEAEALGCARDIQEAFRVPLSEIDGDLVRLRIGVHSGNLHMGQEGVFGLAINVAVRIADHCDPQQVLVSEPVFELGSKLGLTFSYLGTVALKGLSCPMKLYNFDWFANDERPPRPN